VSDQSNVTDSDGPILRIIGAARPLTPSFEKGFSPQREPLTLLVAEIELSNGRDFGRPSSGASENQSGGNGEQIDLAHLNSPVHTSSA
jgi:hypothetical protein